jgi:4-amino-4-deoxy-L-arabinose transferase-like glycosyltransferase
VVSAVVFITPYPLHPNFELKKLTLIFACLFIAGAGLRSVNVWRPVDTTSWRESDVATIARNYVREGMNPFYPRIDWRGSGPGYAEMEFPLYPWMIAVCYKIFGMHEQIGRIMSLIFSILSMLVFFKLAHYLLPEKGAIIASLFYILSPLVIVISNSLQPEGLMFLCYLLAAYYFVRWLDNQSWVDYAVALAATSLAILAKASAAHIGLLFFVILVMRMGFRALLKPRVLLFGVGALVPSLLWYRHAHHLWLTYGNSLGVSNETHWAGWDLFTNRVFIQGIWSAEVFHAWTPIGVVLVMLAIVMYTPAKTVTFCLHWLLAIAAFYLLAARTTGDEWAIYYHVISVPAVALLIGAGLDAITQLKFQRSLLQLLCVASVGLVVVLAVADLLHLSSFDARLLVKLGILAGLSVLLLTALFFTRNQDTKEAGIRSGRLNAVVIYFAGFGLAAACLYQVRAIRNDFRERDAEGNLNACAREFAPAIPENVLIATSGGACNDPTGFPVAYNSSYMFYWLDRKGFNVCEEHQSIAELNLLAAKGARYFIAEKGALKKKPGLDGELRRTFPLIKECSDAYLFELKQSQAYAQSGQR